MKVAQVLGALVSAAAVGACGGNVVLGSPADGGHVGQGSDTGHPGLGSDATTGGDAGGEGQRDAGSGPKDGTTGGPMDARLGSKDAGQGVTYVDAGVYYGDGSFFSDTGVTTVNDSGHSGFDAAGIDASSGCGQLAACCATLSGSTQSLCQSVASSGNAANCTSEVSLLQGDGNCTGVTVLADHVQVPPYEMVSDGTTLFWTTFQGGLEAMRIGGGTVAFILNNCDGNFLAVDAVNVYVQSPTGLVRIPKNGSPATLVNEPGATLGGATTLGAIVYWTEDKVLTGPGDAGTELFVKSAPLLGGAPSLVAETNVGMNVPSGVAVTSATVFFGADQNQTVFDFPLATGVPVTGFATVPGTSECQSLTSDSAAVYCAQSSGSNLRIASDGSTSVLGPAVISSSIVFDDTYVYWADTTTAGSIMRSPKAGGGPATILAYDTSPTAIAVDAHSVYWGDQAGYIKSVAK